MRKALQILLVLPATALAPIGWLVTFYGYSPPSDGLAFAWFTKAALFFIVSFAGLIALWSSIVYTPIVGAIRRRALMAGLTAGLLLDTIMLVYGLARPPRNFDGPVVLLAIWLLGGPLIVGGRNLLIT